MKFVCRKYRWRSTDTSTDAHTHTHTVTTVAQIKNGTPYKLSKNSSCSIHVLIKHFYQYLTLMYQYWSQDVLKCIPQCRCLCQRWQSAPLEPTPIDYKWYLMCNYTWLAAGLLLWSASPFGRTPASRLTDWLAAEVHLKTLGCWPLILHSLTTQPTARLELLATGHVVRSAPNFFSHQKTMGRGMRCQVIVPLPVLAVMLVMLCLIALVPRWHQTDCSKMCRAVTLQIVLWTYPHRIPPHLS